MHLNSQNLKHYLRLIRFEKPIGTFLVLWPTLWALWLAPMGKPSLKNLIIFALGSFIMRSAGCIINDYADRDFDCRVKRTQSRPLTNGDISSQEALELFGLLMLIAFILVLFTNALTIKLAFTGAALTIIYPYMKRITHLPQVILGLAFSYPIPLVWATETSQITPAAWWLMAGTFFWIMAYDTYYAMIDKDDDQTIGIKSTAILFGRWDKRFIALFNVLTLVCFCIVAKKLNLDLYFYISLLIAACLFIYQQHLTHHKTRESCFYAFLNNNWVGAIIFSGILMSLT